MIPTTKKGSVWVSAVLYLALGLVLIGLVIGLALPIVNRISDRNVLAQTKSVMIEMDRGIREVVDEGPGSRRYFSSVSIKKGQISVDEINDVITWTYDTNSKVIEPDTPLSEGSLNVLLKQKPVKGEYTMTITMDFKDIADLQIASNSLRPPLQGTFAMTVENIGYVSAATPSVKVLVQ